MFCPPRWAKHKGVGQRLFTFLVDQEADSKTQSRLGLILKNLHQRLTSGSHLLKVTPSSPQIAPSTGEQPVRT